MLCCFCGSDSGNSGDMRYYRQRELYIGGYGRLLGGGSETLATPYMLLTVENPPKYKASERWRLEGFVETVALCVYRKLAGSAETEAIARGICGVKGMLLDLDARAMFAERADAAPVTPEERAALRRFWVILDNDEPLGDTYRVQCDTVVPGEILYAGDWAARAAETAATAAAAAAATTETAAAAATAAATTAATAADAEPRQQQEIVGEHRGEPEIVPDPLGDCDYSGGLQADMLSSATVSWTFVCALATLALAVHWDLM